MPGSSAALQVGVHEQTHVSVLAAYDRLNVQRGTGIIWHPRPGERGWGT